MRDGAVARDSAGDLNAWSSHYGGDGCFQCGGIVSTGTAVAGDVLTGKTFSNAGGAGTARPSAQWPARAPRRLL